MTDMPNALDRAVSDGFSDETVRRFLLGNLSASEQPLFEQQLMSDVRLDARARLIEFDLSDDYACGRLNRSDRKLFEQRFLVTADRQSKVRVSQVLRERFSLSGPAAVASSSKSQPIFARLAHLFGLDRRAWRIAFSVLILLVLFGTVWLVVREPRLTERITSKIIPRRLRPRSAPREVNHPTNTSSPEHQTNPAPMPEHNSAIPSPQSVVLFPTTPDLGKIPTATLSKGKQDVLRLRLAVTTNRIVPCRAEVLTIDGQSVFSVDWLTGPQFDVDVPMRLLRSGKYQVRLSDARDGAKKEVASYYFLVQ
jgi:hypothetical protein